MADETKLPEYPTIVWGYVRGPMRLETNGGGEQYVEPRVYHAGRWLCNYGPIKVVTLQPDGGNVKKMFGVTHLQKMSRFGFLWARPFCFHFWIQRRFQEQDANGNWIPGTEHTWYGRTPGWRWDAGDGKFVRSKGFISNKHWD